MFYYINNLYLFSFLGFVMESTIYKIKQSHRYSSIFYGPITMVYGFGILILLLVYRFFLTKLHVSKLAKFFITFFISMFVLSCVEWLGGTILHFLFHIDLWNYSRKAFHFGKYVCLELAFVWGALGTLYLFYIKDFTDRIVNLFSKKLSIVLIVINLIDTIFVFINKFPYW